MPVLPVKGKPPVGGRETGMGYFTSVIAHFALGFVTGFVLTTGVVLMNKIDTLLSLLAEVKARVDAATLVDPAKLDQAIANAQAVVDSLPPVPAPPVP